jgi:hypothetical protein
MLLFRWVGQRRKIVDLKDICKDESIFLLGGHPSLKDENLDLFKKYGITTMAMNNTATIVKPDYWVCADPPNCYSKSLEKDPSITKFARLNYTNNLIEGKMWKDYPSTYFYGSTDHIKFHDFLDDHRQCAWWKNIFVIALQLCYHMGFRKIYTVGCSFNINKDQQYAYKTNLDDGQIKYNVATYNMVIDQIKQCVPHMKKKELEIISCTPNSKLDDLFPSMSLDSAIETVLKNYPDHDTISSKHSSEFRQEREKEGGR